MIRLSGSVKLRCASGLGVPDGSAGGVFRGKSLSTAGGSGVVLVELRRLLIVLGGQRRTCLALGSRGRRLGSLVSEVIGQLGQLDRACLGGFLLERGTE